MTEGLAILPSPEIMATRCLLAHHEVTALVATDGEGLHGVSTDRILAGPCIRVLRLPLGGPVLDGLLWVDQATLQVEAWAGTSLAQGTTSVAHTLAATARAVLDRFLPGPTSDGVVLRVTTSSLGFNPDTGQPSDAGPARARYQFDAQVTYRPLALTPTTGS